MDKKKQMDLIRQRNIELSQQLEDIKFQIEFSSNSNNENIERAKDLIVELESIREQFLNIMKELEQKNTEYDYLIDNLRNINKILDTKSKDKKFFKKYFK